MSLFRKSEAIQPQTQQTEGTSEKTVEINYDIIVDRVAERLGPLFRNAASLQQQPSTQRLEELDEPDEDETPEERVKRERRTAKAVRDAVAPYADVFNTSIPEVIRDSVVQSLSPGQKMLYEKYKGEVDEIVEAASSANPALKGQKKLHDRAIKLMLGNHVDEVESLAYKHMQESDLPPQFARPSSGGSEREMQVEMSPLEQQSLSYFQNQRGGAGKWNVEEYKYYQSIKPGYLHEMIAEHKARKEGNK